MSKYAQRKHIIDILFVLALFGVFIATALIVALMGSGIYRGTVENMNRNFDTQTSLTYVSTKIRQNDRADSVYLDDSMPGIQALVLEQAVEDDIYQTWIYHYDGALREIFIKKGNVTNPESGIEIMAMEHFDIERLGGNLYSVSTTDRTGNPIGMVISTRT